MLKLETEPRQVKSQPHDFTWMIYGVAGIGKSTLALSMENPYFLATEPAHEHLPILGTDIRSWADFLTVAELLATTRHPYKVAVVDTLEAAWDLCADHICERESKNVHYENVSELGHGRGYFYARNEFRKPFMQLAQSPLCLVLICHEAIKEREYKGRKESIHVPNLIKTAYDLVMPIVGVAGRIFVDKVPAGDRIREQRFISFAPSTEFVTKDRSKKLSSYQKILIEPEAECWNQIRNKFGKETHRELGRGNSKET